MIEEGWKTIETRLYDKFAYLKGHTIGIHVGKKWDTKWYDLIIADQIQRGLITEHMWDKRDGQIICTAFVEGNGWLDGDSCSQAAMIDCRYTTRFGLFLTNIKPFTSPILRGSQGIWYYNCGLEKKVSANEFKLRKEGKIL
jgi:hypothetical protein